MLLSRPLVSRRKADGMLGTAYNNLRRDEGRAVLEDMGRCSLWFKIRKRSPRLTDENREAGTLGG